MSMTGLEVFDSGVFAVLAKHVTAGEMEGIRRMLPDPLKTLWPVERSEV